MKIINIPPYRHGGVNYDPKQGHFVVREIVENMRRKGQLNGIEMDIDEGYPTDHSSKTRDEEFLANITVGLLKRIREVCEMGKYDAIVTSGGIEPGFFPGRMISNIPIAFCIHSAVHMASLIGDRFAMIQLHDPGCLIVRHLVQLYGLSHKLASARSISSSSTHTMGLLRKYKKEERMKVPEIKKVVDDILEQSRVAIEKDRADSIILGGPYMEVLEDEVRQALDQAGYDEIQLVCEVSSAVEVAKAMVNMKLIQSPRAYPSDHLKAKPEYR